MVAKRRPGIVLTLNSKKPTVIDEVDTSETLSKDTYMSIIDSINDLIDEDYGVAIIGDFIKLPPKKLYPDYYQLIESPISLNEIKAKVKKSDRYSVQEFLKDFQLMANNANTYNDPQSYIAKNANKIYEFVESKIADIISNSKGSETSHTKKKVKAAKRAEGGANDGGQDYTVDLKNILKSIINYKVPSRGKLSTPFMDLVDGEMYPDYYKIIKEGMSFNLVKQKLDDGEYADDKDGVVSFKHDINLIFANAQTYNHEDSLLYQDAVILQKFAKEKIEKLESSISSSSELEDASLDDYDSKSLPRSKKTKITVKKEDNKKKKLPKSRKRTIHDVEEEDEENEESGQDSDDDEQISEDDESVRRAKRTDTHEYNVEYPVEEGSLSEEPAFIQGHEKKAQTNSHVKQITISSSTKSYSQTDSDRLYELTFLNPDTMNAITLPSDIVGQPFVVFVSLSNSIINERYHSELRVNNETVKPFPIAISYDGKGENDFLAARYEIKAGYGINLVEFILKVPELKDTAKGETLAEEESKFRRRAAALSPINATINAEDKNYDVQRIKIWINVSQ
ncbi:hypothetical protein KL918_004347 [Ogataea parapolymorpha]|uniref:Protein polybromo-1 n=1 Tax=Ogataea parapolymorpha (strain ATCC 26012 / BCRC 20466 / JCM 22074 / NRRL Y-7560 / DL-1) TaxID=871575 RepID=W1QI69_OGAPD|nr:Protein polybromo-1 [Ogataea parapolymorpha DL-1]ESX01290.1 Protein polybromo-1 [Ogataea parapolymorpha DL-1]KAG7865868.1 hypothetical protein KL918_004347 [Ogataea parapolymorpha]KAG7872013.1 hypothetical protein KL916_003351 [Ogataea parapolymorpha]